MKLGFFNFYEIYNNNKMFKESTALIGEDLLYPFVYLSQFAKARNIEISTIDTKPLESYDAIVFMDFPTLRNKYFKKVAQGTCENVYLLILESPIIRPDNWNRDNHKYFKKIFTWDNNFIDNKKYIMYCLPQKIPKDLDFNLDKKEKLCTLIAGHKFKSHPLELYTERLKAIRWFEENHPEDFEFYGIGWDKYRFKGILSKFNRFGSLTGLLKSNFPSYRGPVNSKREVLQKYRFAVCYENARDISGYITEKIFDCFFAGCVPIYRGAPNVTNYIPAETFIDKRNFTTYEEMYRYLKNMPDSEYLGYLDAIGHFIQSDHIRPFSAEGFAETIIYEIMKDTQN